MNIRLPPGRISVLLVYSLLQTTNKLIKTTKTTTIWEFMSFIIVIMKEMNQMLTLPSSLPLLFKLLTARVAAICK